MLIIPIKGLRHQKLSVLNVQPLGDIGGLVQIIQADGKIVVCMLHQVPVDQQGEFHGILLLLQLYAAVIVPAVIVDGAAEPHGVVKALDVHMTGQKHRAGFRQCIAESEVKAELFPLGDRPGHLKYGGIGFIEPEFPLPEGIALRREARLREPIDVEHDVHVRFEGFRYGNAVLIEHRMD